MKILVACEESQAVTIELRRLGHEAYSCDLLECSGGHPEWHLKQDVLPLLKEKWDMILAFPPCTFLTVTGNRWFNVGKYGDKAIQRHKDRKAAIEFFMAFAKADCPKIAIENPIGVMSTEYRKPDQIIHPYMFGDPERKSTCLWLKGLQPLNPTDIVEPRIIKYKNGKGTDSPWHMETMKLPPAERSRARSKNFPELQKRWLSNGQEKVRDYEAGIYEGLSCGISSRSSEGENERVCSRAYLDCRSVVGQTIEKG